MLAYILIGFCFATSATLAISIFCTIAEDFFDSDVTCGLDTTTAFYWFVIACGLYYMAKFMGVV